MCYIGCMTKDRTINLRVSNEWLDAVDAAAAKLSEQTGVKVSRNAFIELAVTRYIATLKQ